MKHTADDKEPTSNPKASQDGARDGSKPAGVDNGHLAEVRTSLARSRTYLAAERTFAAWIRTGFTIAGAGVTLGTTLKNTDSRTLALVIGIALISVGIFSFGFAWYDFKKVHDYIRRHYETQGLDTQSFTLNFFTVTLMSVVLAIACILGVYLVLS